MGESILSGRRELCWIGHFVKVMSDHERESGQNSGTSDTGHCGNTQEPLETLEDALGRVFFSF